MSGHMPFEIQLEIMKKLPVKSLIQFRSLSKSCKSLIDSPDFIAHYTGQQQHLLVLCFDYSEREAMAFVDDDSFPTHRASVTLPKSVKYSRFVGSSHGLFCFYGCDGPNSETGRAVIFNLCIRKTVAFVVPGVRYQDLYAVVGFGVCRETKDPKLVKFILGVKSVIPGQVEVFTLSTGAWRSPNTTTLPREGIRICIYGPYPVVVDGCLYWLAWDGPDGHGRDNLIISFDMTSEEFGEVNLPDRLADGCLSLSVDKLRESLAVIEKDNNVGYHVWVMEDGVPKSFKKLYTISKHLSLVSIISVYGFRKTGELLVQVILENNAGSTTILAAYDPYSESITNLGINGSHYLYSAYSYMETLLLL